MIALWITLGVALLLVASLFHLLLRIDALGRRLDWRVDALSKRVDGYRDRRQP